MTDVSEDHEGTVCIGGRTITKIHFADDIDGLAGEEEELAKLLECLDKPPQPILQGAQCREDQADDDTSGRD